MAWWKLGLIIMGGSAYVLFMVSSITHVIAISILDAFVSRAGKLIGFMLAVERSKTNKSETNIKSIDRGENRG